MSKSNNLNFPCFFSVDQAKTLIEKGKVNQNTLVALAIFQFDSAQYLPAFTTWDGLNAPNRSDIYSDPSKIVILDLKVLNDFLKATNKSNTDKIQRDEY